MPSTFLNQLRMMFRTTTSNRESALSTNYSYINEEKISRSLICPICLDPLIDAQTHVLCENSFCNACIRQLRQCPCCRAPITTPHDLKLTSHVIRNILDELEVQCNVCRQTVARGQFASHIRNNCLDHPPISVEEEEQLVNASNPPTSMNKIQFDDQLIEKHLSNLYRRIHTLESELFELKKAIFVSLFVLAAIGSLIFLGSIFSYVTISFLSLLFTEWLPTICHMILKFCFDFSPLMSLSRIVCVAFYFFVFCYKNQPSNLNLVTMIFCSIIVLCNIILLLFFLLYNHLSSLFLLYALFIVARHAHFPLPSHEQLIDIFNQFYRHFTQSQTRRRFSS